MSLLRKRKHISFYSYLEESLGSDGTMSTKSEPPVGFFLVEVKAGKLCSDSVADGNVWSVRELDVVVFSPRAAEISDSVAGDAY